MEVLNLPLVIHLVQATVTHGASANSLISLSSKDASWKELENQLNALGKMCKVLNLPMTGIACARSLAKLSELIAKGVSKEMPPLLRAQIFQTPVNVLKDETTLRFYFHLPEPSLALYKNVAPFGSEVRQAFPSAIVDVEEAAKCLALERPTASVFHSMRCIEFGLRKVISESFADPQFLAEVSTWGSIVNRIRREVNRPSKGRWTMWNGKEDRLMKLALQVEHIADAFRNPTMHCTGFYTVEQAKDVFQAAGAFLRRLAEDFDGAGDGKTTEDIKGSSIPAPET